MNRPKPLRVNPDSIVFPAVLQGGVPYGDPDTCDEADRLAAVAGTKVTGFSGSFEEMIFEVEPMTEDQVEAIEDATGG